MLTFLLVVHAIITATLVGVILMQRSEGGGLGMGGSPTGLMSARGAADFLTRATTILASLFVILSIASAVIASRSAIPSAIDTSLARKGLPASIPAAPVNDDPLAAAAGAMGNQASPVTVPAPTQLPSQAAPAASRAKAPQAERKPATASATSRPVPKADVPAIVPTTPAPIAAPAPAPSNSN